MATINTKGYVMNDEESFSTKTILGNFVFINEENKSKEFQSKNVLSFTKFVLGGFCPGAFCPDTLKWNFQKWQKSFIDKCPPLRSSPNKSPPPPRAKARMQKPQGGGKFLVQIPGGCAGMVMDEIDTCISLVLSATCSL